MCIVYDKSLRHGCRSKVFGTSQSRAGSYTLSHQRLGCCCSSFSTWFSLDSADFQMSSKGSFWDVDVYDLLNGYCNWARWWSHTGSIYKRLMVGGGEEETSWTIWVKDADSNNNSNRPLAEQESEDLTLPKRRNGCGCWLDGFIAAKYTTIDVCFGHFHYITSRPAWNYSLQQPVRPFIPSAYSPPLDT